MEKDELPIFTFLGRPNIGSEGHPISLQANHFQIRLPNSHLHHYIVQIVPEKCPRKVNREIIGTMINCFPKVFHGQKPVFDGRKNLYVKDFIRNVDDEMDFEVTLPGNGADKKFHVSIKYASKISLSVLNEVLMEKGKVPPMNAIQAIDTILRYLPSMRYISVGKSFFSAPDGYDHPLGGGREVWFGFHQSVNPTQWKMLLNIDVSATAFYKAQPVIDFLQEIITSLKDNLSQPLTNLQIIQFLKEIKGLKIEINHCGTTKRKYRVCNITQKTASMQTFPFELENGQIIECTVANYFLNKYHFHLRYPHLPCLHVGQEDKHIYLPLEVCQIVAGQRNRRRLTDYQTARMITVTERKASDRENDIHSLMEKDNHSLPLNSIQNANICCNPYTEEFGLSVNDTMVAVQGRILQPPKLLYGSNAHCSSTSPQAIPSHGIWDMRNRQFYTGIKIHTWGIACFAPQRSCPEDALKKFYIAFQKIGNESGMPVINAPRFCKYCHHLDDVEPMLNFVKKTYLGLQLILVVLEGKSPIYAEVKRVGDVLIGISTQCIQTRNVVRPLTQTLSNLCLKVNVKLGGINNILLPGIRPRLFEEPVIFLGGDMTHPPAGDNRKPTVAAVVGSMDGHPSRYSASVRMQEGRTEVICDLAAMVQELLIQFYQSTHFKPTRIIMYRYGVPSGQYKQVLRYELIAIRKACLTLEADYKPGITYVMVSRRHHTRLFCADKRNQIGRNANIPAGTTLDVGITHPVYFDFYLCSHCGLRGTSKPSHYQVLWDDNKLNADDLQSLTYQLCYTYARCTRSVSIPAPAYYAHLVAFRARYHLAGKDNESGENTIIKSPVVNEDCEKSKSRNVAVHENTNKVMYFV